MLKRQGLLLLVIGCIISAGSLLGASAGTAVTNGSSVRQEPAGSVNLQPLQFSAFGVDSRSTGYILQVASTKADKPSPYTGCPGGVDPDFPKPHDGGGGKKKSPGPLVEPCTPYGGPVTRG
jgi:hypothetical protein